MSILSIFSIVRSLMYFGAGMFLILGKNIFNFNDIQRFGLGILLLAYGTFRTYSSVKKIREKEEENDN